MLGYGCGEYGMTGSARYFSLFGGLLIFDMLRSNACGNGYERKKRMNWLEKHYHTFRIRMSTTDVLHCHCTFLVLCSYGVEQRFNR